MRIYHNNRPSEEEEGEDEEDAEEERNIDEDWNDDVDELLNEQNSNVASDD